MLIRYKKTMEKIAMGLLSFMPQHKEIKNLMETIQQYDQLENWQLYLLKRNEEYIGAIGVIVENQVAIIQHVTVIPSYRGEGVGKEMICQLHQLGSFEAIQSSNNEDPFIQKCMKEINEQSCDE